jgi:flagellar biosynthetic protein FlhB
MAEESDLEKTESPSPRRLEQAREEGQAPHSRELSSFAVMLSSGLGLGLLGQELTRGLRADLRASLSFDHSLMDHPERMAEQLGQVSTAAILHLLPWLGLVFMVALVAPLTLSGFLFSTKNFMPDFSRLSPARGLGGIFSSSGLAELVKAILKALLIGGLAAWFLWSSRGAALGLGHTDLESGIAGGVALLQRCIYVLLAGMGAVVAIDVPFQLWRHHDSLKMTREELRQEAKESDGDPQVKQRIRQQQREASRRRMMAEVPKADVVVTNPTHYAVALRYEQGLMRAPRVVAKGGDLVALRIRGLAEQHGIPILEQPPLARALFKHADLDHEVPPVLYAAVAEVLAYIFQLRAWRDGSGAEPRAPATVEVPAEVAVDATAPTLPELAALPQRATAAGGSSVGAVNGVANGGVART